MPNLPTATTHELEYLADHSTQLGRVADLLTEQNELLRQVLTARQTDPAGPEPEPAEDNTPAGPVPVKLREPDPPRDPAPAELREPEPAPEPKPTRPARGGRRSTKAST
jgi:hypothetical protein